MTLRFRAGGSVYVSAAQVASGLERLEDRLASAGMTASNAWLRRLVFPAGLTAMANAVIDRTATHFACAPSDVAEIDLTVKADLSVTAAWVSWASSRPHHVPVPEIVRPAGLVSGCG